MVAQCRHYCTATAHCQHIQQMSMHRSKREPSFWRLTLLAELSIRLPLVSSASNNDTGFSGHIVSSMDGSGCTDASFLVPIEQACSARIKTTIVKEVRDPHPLSASTLDHNSTAPPLDAKQQGNCKHHSNGAGKKKGNFIAYTPSTTPSLKAKRKRASPTQLSILRQSFSRNAFPSPAERRALAEVAGMTERAVQIWFQNGRQARKHLQS